MQKKQIHPPQRKGAQTPRAFFEPVRLPPKLITLDPVYKVSQARVNNRFYRNLLQGFKP